MCRKWFYFMSYAQIFAYPAYPSLPASYCLGFLSTSVPLDFLDFFSFLLTTLQALHGSP